MTYLDEKLCWSEEHSAGNGSGLGCTGTRQVWNQKWSFKDSENHLQFSNCDGKTAWAAHESNQVLWLWAGDVKVATRFHKAVSSSYFDLIIKRMRQWKDFKSTLLSSSSSFSSASSYASFSTLPSSFLQEKYLKEALFFKTVPPNDWQRQSRRSRGTAVTTSTSWPSWQPCLRALPSGLQGLACQRPWPPSEPAIRNNY